MTSLSLPDEPIWLGVACRAHRLLEYAKIPCILETGEGHDLAR